MRERFDAITAMDGSNTMATCIALDDVSVLGQRLGVADHFTVAQDSIVRLGRGRGHTDLAPRAVMYSNGGTDYLRDALDHLPLTCADRGTQADTVAGSPAAQVRDRPLPERSI